MSTEGAADLRQQSTAELLKQLSTETTTLVRQELELAKAEMTEKGKEAGKGIGMFGAAGLVGLLALGAFTTFLIAVLDTAMDTWLAALIVTVVYAAIAGVLALTGKGRLSNATPVAPEQTQDNVKEDVRWVKTRARSNSR
ncbi:MAG: phage holin family protein [Solirubrobacterales bacterium]|nr:phage holin family protein [Solirubrobacterales bacterium]